MRDHERQLGARAYALAHARVGDSTHPSLARSAALAECPPDVNLDEWLLGWLGAREEHFLDRCRHLSHAWVPLPGL